MPKSFYKKQWLNTLVIWLILAFGCFNQYWFIIKDHWMLVPGDLGDSRLEVLLLEHAHNLIRGNVIGSFWGPAWNFAPQPNSLAMSDIMLGSIPFYSPWRFLGVDPWTAYQYWIIGAGIANFFTAKLLARALGLTAVGSAIAAYIFAFSLPRAGFLNHSQLMAHWWTPLAAYFFIQGTMSQKRASTYFYCSLSGAALAAQFWSAFYLGWFALVGLIGLTISSALLRPRDSVTFLMKNLRSLTVFCFVFGACTLPLAIKYLEMAKIMGTRSIDTVIASLPTFYTWLLPADSSFFYNWLFLITKQSITNYGENVMFPGLLPLAAAFGSLFLLNKSRGAKFKGLELGVLVFFSVFLMTLHFGKQESLWKLLVHIIPGAKAIRAMSRICLVMLLPLGLCTGAMWDHLQNKFGRILGMILLVLILAEQYSTNEYGFLKTTAIARAEAVAGKIGKDCEYFYYTGKNEPEFMTHLDAMWASANSHIPTINGYSGGEHPKYRELGLINPRNATIPAAQAWLAQWVNQEKKICLIAP